MRQPGNKKRQKFVIDTLVESVKSAKGIAPIFSSGVTANILRKVSSSGKKKSGNVSRMVNVDEDGEEVTSLVQGDEEADEEFINDYINSSSSEEDEDDFTDSSEDFTDSDYYDDDDDDGSSEEEESSGASEGSSSSSSESESEVDDEEYDSDPILNIKKKNSRKNKKNKKRVFRHIYAQLKAKRAQAICMMTPLRKVSMLGKVLVINQDFFMACPHCWTMTSLEITKFNTLQGFACPLCSVYLNIEEVEQRDAYRFLCEFCSANQLYRSIHLHRKEVLDDTNPSIVPYIRPVYICEKHVEYCKDHLNIPEAISLTVLHLIVAGRLERYYVKNTIEQQQQNKRPQPILVQNNGGYKLQKTKQRAAYSYNKIAENMQKVAALTANR